MGYVEVYNIDKDGQWQDLNDIPFITTVNCQLCNEPTEAHDIIVTARIVEGEVVAGTWQCKKCKAVNGQQGTVIDLSSLGIIHRWCSNGLHDWIE